MATPTVSVNICTYNSSRYIAATLRSVFAQTLQDFEIVVVDDGSDDGTPELIAREFPDPRITVVRERHVTLRVARPLALAHSRGEFIAFVDSDDLWAATKLEEQVAVARARPDAALIFSDCDLVGDDGTRLGGRFSDQFAYRDVDFSGGRVHLELLRRGNFIASPTPMVPAATLRAVGGFNHGYRHVNDYELWLRLARQFPFVYLDEPLASYRVHDGQFTQRRMEITLPEQCALLHPIMRSASYPADVRVAIGDNLFGQHRLAWCSFIRQRRYFWAIGAALGMCRYPDRLLDYARDKAKDTVVGWGMESTLRARHLAVDAYAKIRVRAVHAGLRVATQAKRAARFATGRRGMRRAVRGVVQPAATEPRRPVWIDGTCLGREQVGYFNLLTELIRSVTSGAFVVHVTADRAGRRALQTRLGDAANGIEFHAPGWRVLHWTQAYELLTSWHVQLLVAIVSLTAIVFTAGRAPRVAALLLFVLAVQAAVLLDHITTALRGAYGVRRETFGARALRYAWRRWPAPRRRALADDAIEILFWRGRFRWHNARRIAVVQDLTTRIHPDLHTGPNITEFDEFLRYVQRHAHDVLTVSEQSRRDIIERIAVSPDRVSVLTMPVHPQYVQPHFSRGYVALYGIRGPYVLCVGTIEPRKNLRRLVKAFDLVRAEDALAGHDLVIVGSQGWDATFGEFLRSVDVVRRVRVLGYAALEHLPSLYHYAGVVACPSVYEGFGLPVLEAMCSSGVVVASRTPAFTEVLGDGIQFDPYDTQSLATALLAAASMSPEAQAEYRTRNRRRAEKHLERLAAEGPLPGITMAAAGTRV